MRALENNLSLSVASSLWATLLTTLWCDTVAQGIGTLDLLRYATVHLSTAGGVTGAPHRWDAVRRGARGAAVARVLALHALVECLRAPGFTQTTEYRFATDLRQGGGERYCLRDHLALLLRHTRIRTRARHNKLSTFILSTFYCLTCILFLLSRLTLENFQFRIRSRTD